MSEYVRVDGVGGPPNEYYINNKTYRENNKNISERIKEENVKAEIEREKEKEIKDRLKKSIISEDDLKMLLLVFGSKGDLTLLEQVVEKKKKESRVI